MHAWSFVARGIFRILKTLPSLVYLTPMYTLGLLLPFPEAFLAPPVYRDSFLLLVHSLLFGARHRGQAKARRPTPLSPAPSVISSPLPAWGQHLAGLLLGLPLLNCAQHSFLLEMVINQFMCAEKVDDSWRCSQTFKKKKGSGVSRRKKAKSRTGTKTKQGVWALESNLPSSCGPVRCLEGTQRCWAEKGLPFTSSSNPKNRLVTPFADGSNRLH